MTTPRTGARRRAPLLMDVLSSTLPTAAQTQFLQALLLGGEAGAAAFQEWHAAVGDARRALGADEHGLKQMLALLYVAMRGHGAAGDAALTTYLRIASARERLRRQAYVAVCAQALAALDGTGVPALLVGGAAAAILAYDDPTLRHAHGIDLLVAGADLARAATSLRDAGCRDTSARGDGARRVLVHHSGAPIVLHTRLFALPYYREDGAHLWAASGQARIGGVPARVPSPADLLVQLCVPGSALYARHPPWWVCDGWLLSGRLTDRDWQAVLERARAGHLGMPLFVSLRYLHEALGAPVPAAVLAQLHARAVGNTATGYEAALWALRATLPLPSDRLLRHARTWRSRAILLKWLLAPAPTHLALATAWTRPALLPIFYGYRLARAGARRCAAPVAARG